MKFGSEENISLTWAVNSYMPALVADYFRGSDIVAFSTGCVYPLVPVRSGGSVETDPPVPVGEYAKPCLGMQITDSNAAFFDAANNFKGCIVGLHEVLRRQGLLEKLWTLNDDAFVAENLQRWLS